MLYLLDCTPVRYRKALSVALKSLQIIYEDLLRKPRTTKSHMRFIILR